MPKHPPKVYLIPTPISSVGVCSSSDNLLSSVIDACTHFFVERMGSAVQYCKHCMDNFHPEEKEWIPLHKKEQDALSYFSDTLSQGAPVAIMSEAGCPCIADPGHLLVLQAHRMGAEVIPLVGPSAILLALMASGLNGQSFAFHGYLPVKEPLRQKSIKEYERASQAKCTAQIFIETPYRNQNLLDALLKSLQPSTMLSVSTALLSLCQDVSTRSVSEWRATAKSLSKEPTIFIFQSCL